MKINVFHFVTTSWKEILPTCKSIHTRWLLPFSLKKNITDSSLGCFYFWHTVGLPHPSCIFNWGILIKYCKISSPFGSECFMYFTASLGSPVCRQETRDTCTDTLNARSSRQNRLTYILCLFLEDSDPTCLFHYRALMEPQHTAPWSQCNNIDGQKSHWSASTRLLYLTCCVAQSLGQTRFQV